MILDGAQPDAIARAADALAAGELVGLPTETVYGLAADAGSDAAVRAIFAAKGRPTDHPLIVHLADASAVPRFAAAVPDFAQRLIDTFWPGPLTLILPRQAGVADAAAGGHPTIGLRCPAHPVAHALLAACAARGVPVVQTYGLTETASQVATLAPADALRKLGSAGKPLFPTELRVARDGATASSGAVGEIQVRGPTVMRGYVDRPEATAQALADGWLHTGDLGYLDDEGYLYVASRRDDLIVSGGENVYPAEVEAVLLSHPAIAEAAVLGAPDERWGQVPVAFVKLRAGVTADESTAIAFCRERLAGYKVPKRVRFVDALPRNAGGKVLRNDLREALIQGAN